MASDFGDESGEKLFDWLLRIGQDAGEQAMLQSADKLANAFRKAREGIDGEAKAAATSDVREWAKLDMKNFAELPQYKSLKEIISGELASRGIEHVFAEEAGSDFLVFKAKDVHEIADVFHQLENKVVEEKEHAREAGIPEREHARDEKAERRQGQQKPKAKGPDLDAPATEKQRGYIDSLKARNVIPEEELEKTAGAALTIGVANEILNKYGRFLKLDRDSEPLEQRAASARAASKAMEANKTADREIHLSQNRSK
ncbi:hypothetical protein [Curtanaerobium respiraculi]|uniref:hypothetical protein n=1 Tax=Curtanaerobium respiraculi TaxID=2949669 RepID=UPI0024B3237B|nr:hypothetical protein [Curtanaerobium respiraculi]